MDKISIIIPVLNEASSIVHFLTTLQYYRDKGHELILVDGGSYDKTIELANKFVDKNLISLPGRALQMNQGALSSGNKILLFLHADTYLPKYADEIIIKSINASQQWGRFNIRLSGNRIIFRIIERFINIRSKLSSIATGDQAIFVYRDTFFSINKYPEILLMEDIALCKRLKKISSCISLNQVVTTSSRRWENNGIFRSIVTMWVLRFLYFIGVNPTYLAKHYYGFE